ncbi:MAG: hypothetical protein J7K23_06495 [Thermoproteales archaeon]|nr:hypothetical protein [Thermoproteales archaeon]
MKCMYVNCDTAPEYLIQLEGQQIALCRKHYTRLVNTLNKIALKYKKASLNEDIYVKKIRGRVRFVSKKPIRKKK